MDVSEELVLANAAVAAKHFKPLGFEIMQLDHGWQAGDITGDWQVDRKSFPHGLKWLADELKVEPVPNTSEGYNYYEWNSKHRASAAQNVHSDTREQPKPLIAIEGESQRYLPSSGGTILFSGAQLHESVRNTTDEARYSIDFRTVHVGDVRARRGAPNVDSKCTGTTMRDYLRGTDLSKIPDDLVAMYDDGSATGDKVLYFGDRLAVTASAPATKG